MFEDDDGDISEQQWEELAKSYPDLIQKSQQDYLGVGPGWFNIIEVLCMKLSHDVIQARHKLKYAMEHQGSKNALSIPDAEMALENALESLPSIAQIKEKFGGLRFYVDGASEEQHNYIEFAESMAARTCEECGSPGKIRNNSWMKCLCNKCQDERYPPEESTPSSKKHNEGPKLSDE